MKSLNSLIKSHKFDWVNSNITEANFPAPKTIRTEFKLYHFNRYVSSEDATKEMEKDGYSPATVYELISWKEWNEKDFIVALGSVAEVDGRPLVVYLSRDVSGRYLRLVWFGGGWGAGCRFLAVRDSYLSTSDTQTITFRPSEPLVALCPHCRKEIKLEK